MKRYYFVVGYNHNDKPSEILFEDRSNVKMSYQGGEVCSMSRGYDTLDELKVKEKITDNPCCSCGGIVITNYTNGQVLRDKNLCFSCNFWDEKIEEQHKPNKFVINGAFYSDGGRSNKPNHCLGFGGAEFKIETFDGRIIETNNLWCASKISKYYIDKFPDNAKFCKVEKFLK